VSETEPGEAAATPGEAAAVTEGHARRLRNGIITISVLAVLIIALLFAVPGLHGVGRVVTRMTPGWVVAAVVFQILSCVSYVLTFLLVFDKTPVVFGARVAITELAFGSAVSLGGAGSLAIGAWLLRGRLSLGEIAERSAVLFLLTSAINAITLVIAGLALGLGILPGPRDPLLTLLPAGLVILVIAGLLALPRLSDRFAAIRGTGRRAALARGTSRTIRDTRRLLLRPDWRLLGAFGYLWFNIAVMWACFRATGYTPPLAVIVLAYQIGYLANVIPVPGNIGVLEGSFVAMLVLYHVHATTAAAAAVVYHAIALWIPAGWGTVAFLRLRRSRGPLVPRGEGSLWAQLRRARRGVQ
jgi:uncharacterized membrane protein YbhN (UPF0104 family)